MVTMPRYELRLTLPDHPGSFGAAASAIGRAGANIISFETVETAEGIAVDQLLLDLEAKDVDKDVLAALEDLPDVQVELFQPVPKRPVFDGPLELIESLVHAPQEQVLQALVDGIPGTMRSSWAVVAADRRPQPRRLNGSVGAPSLVGAAMPWLPLTQATVLPLGDWTPSRWRLKESQAQVAAAPLNQTGDTALVTVRKAGPAFRQREIRILAVLAMIAGRLSGMTPPQV